MLWLYLFFWVWCVPWSRISLDRSSGHPLEKAVTVFPVAAPFLIPEPHREVPVSPPPCQHWFLWPGGRGAGTGWPVVALWFQFPCQVLVVVSMGACQLSVSYLICVCAQVLCLLCNWVICLPLLSFRGSLYILGTNYKTVLPCFVFLRCPHVVFF